MGSPSYLIAISLIALQALLPMVGRGEVDGYGAIVVRGDVYADWVVAASYGVRVGAPVVTLLPGVNDPEVIGLLAGLTAYEERPRILVIGDRLAVPEDFVRRVRSLGVTVDRVGGPTRADTAVNVVTQLWMDCERVVVVNGSDTGMYMPALLLSRELNAPILFSTSGELPSSFWGALDTHLTRLGEVYVLDGSLSGAEAEALRERGVEIVEIEPEEAGVHIGFGRDWLSQAAREILTVKLGAGILVGGIVGYLMAARRVGRRSEDRLLSVLMPDERLVVGMILAEGEVTQDSLPARTGFSKAKVSKLVQDLIDRGLVMRERRGKTYVLRPAKIFKAR